MSDRDPQSPSSGVSPTSLRIIRISLLMGVITFGAIVTWMLRDSPPRAPQMARPLLMVNAAYLVGAMVGILYFQRLYAAETAPQRRGTFNVIAWAMGESTALFGGVHYMLVGNPVPFLVGLGMLIASFVLVPIRD